MVPTIDLIAALHLTSDTSSGCETSTSNRPVFGPSDLAHFGDNWIFEPVVHGAVYLDTEDATIGKPSWRIQIYRALNTIDHIGHSKFAAKQEQDWLPGESVKGLYSFGFVYLDGINDALRQDGLERVVRQGGCAKRPSTRRAWFSWYSSRSVHRRFLYADHARPGVLSSPVARGRPRHFGWLRHGRRARDTAGDFE